MKKEDFIVNFIYCTIMVLYLFIIVIFNFPPESIYVFFLFLLFVPLQSYIKKNFQNKKRVNYNNILLDEVFLDRPYRTNNPQIDALKKQCRMLYIPSRFGFVFYMLFIIAYRHVYSEFKIIFIIFASIIFFFIPILSKLYKKKYDELENLYKTEIEFMFQNYLPDMNYSPFEGISEENYRFANFSEFDLFESEDYIYGKMHNRNYVISEVCTYIRHEDENGKVSYTQEFQGTCGIINIVPPIASFIYIVTPDFGVDVNGFKITTDNYEFNNNYDIFTNNELIATMLLTPKFMQKILDFRKKLGIYVEVKIHYDVVFFRFHTGNLFAPTIWNQNNEDKNFAMYFQLIKNMKELMSDAVKILDELSPYK